MAEEKSESKQVKLTEGQVPPQVNKVIEFGEVPPKLNLAGEVIVGGNVPPSTNIADGIKGMVPQALPKIPLEQPVQQPTQSSGGGQNTSSGEQAANTDKK
ncbi:MAG: hypothetical protein C0417_10395 [Chlorobiaceae bacterium]|nr:hypothetical protein [Chlorobiaceae bacterium]